MSEQITVSVLCFLGPYRCFPVSIRDGSDQPGDAGCGSGAEGPRLLCPQVD